VAQPKKPTPKSSKKPIEHYAVQEVCTIYCANSNPVDVILAETDQGRGVLGVVDGSRSRGIETDEDVVSRKDLLPFLGYKLCVGLRATGCQGKQKPGSGSCDPGAAPASALPGLVALGLASQLCRRKAWPRTPPPHSP
jgi:hypothetical protein